MIDMQPFKVNLPALVEPLTVDAAVWECRPCDFDPDAMDPRYVYDVTVYNRDRKFPFPVWHTVSTEQSLHWALTMQNYVRRARSWLGVRIVKKPR